MGAMKEGSKDRYFQENLDTKNWFQRELKVWLFTEGLGRQYNSSIDWGN